MVHAIDFLRNIQPFSKLPGNILEATAAELKELDYFQEKIIYEQEISMLRGVEIIVSGSIETFFYDSQHNKRDVRILQPGEIYGAISILYNQRLSIRTVIVKPGTHTYFLHRKTFKALCKHYAPFIQFFQEDFSSRMLDENFLHFFKKPTWKDESFSYTDQFFSKKIESVAYRPIISATADTPVYEVAQKMSDNKVSCLFILDQQGTITGYVTDILLRDRIIAGRKDAALSVEAIMGQDLASVDVDEFVFEAILKMYRQNTRYLLVRKGQGFIGFLSRNKLLAEQAQSPILFIQSIKLASTTHELRTRWAQVPAIIAQLLERGVHAGVANQVITTVSDTIAEKVIENVIAEMGEPPARFCFMVLGSEGRKEQTFKTDQDNAIIYEDKANEHREEVRKYFLAFAQRVSDNLNTIGISYCTGGFMAQNPKWTHSLSHWKRNYESWMNEALPETMVNFATFFDCRFLFGEKSIMDELYAFIRKELQNPMERVFFFMTRNALQYEPPLTFFKAIKTFKKDHAEVFDIKKVMTPIVDLARVYSLKNQILELNTGERILSLFKNGVFSEKEYLDLSQSYYTLMSIRLRHQTNQIMVDKWAPDNLIPLKELSRIELLTLTEIFKTIKTFQLKIKVDFTKQL